MSLTQTKTKTKNGKTAREHTKVVVRGLPPMLTDAAFTETLERAYKNLGENQIRHNWYCYYAGKVTKQQRKISSRAYLNFDSTEHVQIFARIFNRHKFVDTQGTQFFCSVEMAPFQKLPKEKKKKKKDPREGTIDKDPEFKSFVSTLETESKPKPSAEIWLAKREAEEKEREAVEGPKSNVIVTPLMQHMQEKYAAKLARKISGISGRSGRIREASLAISNSQNSYHEEDGIVTSISKKDLKYDKADKNSSRERSSGRSGRRRDRGRERDREREREKEGGKDGKEKKILRDAIIGEVKLKSKQFTFNSKLSSEKVSSEQKNSSDEANKDSDDIRVIEIGGRQPRGSGKGASAKPPKAAGQSTSSNLKWVPKPG